MLPICEREVDSSLGDGDVFSACDSFLEWHHLTCLGKTSRQRQIRGFVATATKICDYIQFDRLMYFYM